MKKQPIFLERLPAAIEATQRAILEAIKVSCSLIRSDYAEIERVISGLLPRDPDDVSETERTTLIRSAWSIIDRIDVLRLCLEDQSKNFDVREKLEFWEEVSSAAQDCRNFMDHLPGRLKSKRKQRSALPVYGILTFNWYPDGDLEFILQSDGRYKVNLHARNIRYIAASSTYKVYSLNIENMVDDKIWKKFGNVNLFAADTQVNLSKARDIAVHLPELVSTALSEAWDKIVEARIFAGEADIEQYYVPSDVPNAANLRWPFDEPATMAVDAAELD